VATILRMSPPSADRTNRCRVAAARCRVHRCPLRDLGCAISAARSRLRVVCCALSAARCQLHVARNVTRFMRLFRHRARLRRAVRLVCCMERVLVASSRGAHRLAMLLLRVPSAYLECPKEHPECQRCANALAPAHICAGTGWARPCPHLHRDSAHDCHICTGTLGHSSSSALHRRLQHG